MWQLGSDSHVEVVHDETMAFLSDSVHDQKIQVSPSTSPLNRSVRSRSNWIRLPQLRTSPNKVAPLEIDNPVGLPKSPTDDLDNESFADSLPKSTPSRDALWKARLQILLASVLYGTSFPLTKILDDHIPLGPSLTLRFGLASLVTLPWLWEHPVLDWKTSRPALVQGMQVGVWVSIGFLAQAIGIVTTKANKVRTNGGGETITVIMKENVFTKRRFFPNTASYRPGCLLLLTICHCGPIS